MTTLDALHSLVAQGESETLKLKRSTAEMGRAGELCASLNAGKVIFGVADGDKQVGHRGSEKAHREIAAMLYRPEPLCIVLRLAHQPRDNRPGGAA